VLLRVACVTGATLKSTVELSQMLESNIPIDRKVVVDLGMLEKIIQIYDIVGKINMTSQIEDYEHTSLVCCSRIADNIFLYFTMPTKRKNFRAFRVYHGRSPCALYLFSQK